MVRFFFGNFWQGQDGRAFDFLAGFLFVGYLGPEMSSKFWQVIPQQFKGAWFTPKASWAHFLFDSPESLKKRLLLEVVSAMTFVSQN